MKAGCITAVDLFAGAGGFSTGAQEAGVSVLWAANHWPLAVDVHSRRHPETAHACQDLNQADFTQLPDHDILLASPACQGHSNAGQGARGKWGLQFGHHDTSRSTAWAVVSAAEAKAPKAFLVENVPQFARWSLYKHWRGSLETLGYVIEEAVLDAADFGVPQNRSRLFICGRLGAAPGVLDSFPKPTRKARPAWSGMGQILNVDGGEGWRPVSSKSAAVQERVARSRARHGDVFLTQHVRDHMGRSLAQPLPTITTGDQMALVRGDEMRPLSISEYLAGQGFDPGYLEGVHLTRKDASRLIGNAVCPPVATNLVGRLSEAVAA